MNGEPASASENLDQDVEQMRSEGKGRQSGTGKWQCLHACVWVCVCVYARVCEQYVCGYMARGM